MQIDIGEDMPKNLKKLLQRRYIVQLRLNEFNLKDGFENYTVAKIFDEHLHDTKVCQFIFFSLPILNLWFIKKKMLIPM